jgi:hypothetical protein
MRKANPGVQYVKEGDIEYFACEARSGLEYSARSKYKGLPVVVVYQDWNVSNEQLDSFSWLTKQAKKRLRRKINAVIEKYINDTSREAETNSKE